MEIFDRGGTSIFKTLGANNHTGHDRAEWDYYATDPKAAELLLDIEDIPKDKPIWEPAAGELALSYVFINHGYQVRSSDIIARLDGVEELDFLSPPLFSNDKNSFNGTIITNPPYKQAQKFIEKALDVVTKGNKVCMFLKLLFLESQARRKLYQENPPIRVWVSSSRLGCARNGNFAEYEQNGSAVAYAWYIWEKGFKGDTILKWFN